MNATLAHPRRLALSTPPTPPEEEGSLQEKSATYAPVPPESDKETDDKKCSLRHACANAMDSAIELLRNINAKHEKPQ